MTNWMTSLTRHYERTREQHPDDKLLIIFDIDNTILDMRCMILHVLRQYDRVHGSRHFAKTHVDDLNINENQVETFLTAIDMPDAERERITQWYYEHRWTTEAILEGHRPFSGVMEVVRWFQMQPRTFVGLNTGRPESIREQTLRSLNAIGTEYKVIFDDAFLHMSPGDWGENTESSKVAGVKRYIDMGYRVVAVVDNEPENLKVIAEAFPERAMLMLHADTIFDSKRSRLPARSISGNEYDLTELISESRLPKHVQFVWHGVNDEANLRQFLASNVQWAECDVRLDPVRSRVVVRHDSFNRHPLKDGEALLTLRNVVTRIRRADKSLKLDLKEGQTSADALVRSLHDLDVNERHLWINGSTQDLTEDIFRQISREFPNAVLQCPVGYMAPRILSEQERARERLDEFRSWGVNRLSIAWNVDRLSAVIDQVEAWGFEVNVYNVPDLESFLRVVLLRPRSITSDFNFPKWHYYGRGSGAGQKHHTYKLDPSKDQSQKQ